MTDIPRRVAMGLPASLADGRFIPNLKGAAKP